MDPCMFEQQKMQDGSIRDLDVGHVDDCDIAGDMMNYLKKYLKGAKQSGK